MTEILNGENQNKSTVQRLLSKMPNSEETDTKKETETNAEPVKKEESKETKKEVETETEEKPETQELILTEELAKQLGVDSKFVGKKLSVEDDTSIGESLISEELAEVLNLPKTFVGKPVSEAGKSYREAVNWENRNNKEIKKLSQAIEDLQSKLKPQDLKNIKKEVDEEMEEIPDPVTEPEEYRKWIKDHDQKLVDKILSEFEKKTNSDPVRQQAQELAAKNLETEILTTIQAGLPEGVKAGDVIDEWYKANEEDYEAIEKSGIYLNKPKKFARDILLFYKANSFDSLSTMKESEIKKLIHTKTVENLEAKGKITKTDLATNPRTKPPKKTDTGSTVGRLLQNLEQKEANKNQFMQ